jgi:hypothetical protein
MQIKCNSPLSLEDIDILINSLNHEINSTGLDCLRVLRTVGVKNFSFLAENSFIPISKILRFLLTLKRHNTHKFHSTIIHSTIIQPIIIHSTTNSTHPSNISFIIPPNSSIQKNIFKTKINYLELGEFS